MGVVQSFFLIAGIFLRVPSDRLVLSTRLRQNPQRIHIQLGEHAMKLSLKSFIIAAALFHVIGFLFVSLLNIILPPYGGAWIAVLTSLYPGYRPEQGPISIVVGVLYALLAGGVAGALFAWLYNRFADRV
jgi:hypothetical protein